MMVEVFRFQIGTYIALVALFGALVVLKEYAALLRGAFVATTFVFFVEMAIWGYYITFESNVLATGSGFFVAQNIITVGLTLLLAFSALLVLMSPD